MKNHISVERFDSQQVSVGSLVEDSEGMVFMAVSMDNHVGNECYNLIRLKDGTALYNATGAKLSISDLLPRGYKMLIAAVTIEPDEMEGEEVSKFPIKIKTSGMAG